MKSHNLLHSRQSILTSGLLVAAFTFASFFLFFLRDIYLARTYGVNEQLDTFFISFLIPMFAVNVLTMPLGLAFIPTYEQARNSKDQSKENYIAYINKVTFTLASLISIGLLIATPFILTKLGYKLPINLSNGMESYLFFLPILIFLLSNQIILGNSILNAHNKSHIPALAQLVVPLTAILSIFIFSSRLSITAVLLGMLLGQLLNYVLIKFSLNKLNIHLNIGFTSKIKFKVLNFDGLYLPLVVAAFFTAIAPAISTLFTLKLPHGNLSAFNLGNKIVLFITGILSTLVSSLLLPYFANLLANQKSESAKEELAFFINASNYLAIPFCLILFIYSTDIASFLFDSETVPQNQLAHIARVIQYTVIQIPFYLTGLIFLKFFIASKKVNFMLLIGLISLCVNIVTTSFLLKYMGINGVTLGYTTSVLFSALAISLLGYSYNYMSLSNLLNLIVIWLLFICILMNLHFKNVIGISITGLLSFTLFINNFQTYLLTLLKKHIKFSTW